MAKSKLYVRLVIILVALLTSVFADSIFYTMSMLMDGACVVVIIWAALPLVKSLLSKE